MVKFDLFRIVFETLKPYLLLFLTSSVSQKFESCLQQFERASHYSRLISFKMGKIYSWFQTEKKSTSSNSIFQTGGLEKIQCREIGGIYCSF